MRRRLTTYMWAFAFYIPLDRKVLDNYNYIVIIIVTTIELYTELYM